MNFETIWQKPRPLSTRKTGQILREAAHSLMGRMASEAAERALIEMIGDARFILMGEASHGTHEFYEFRVRLTRRLLEQKEFRILAVEADSPDMQRVDSFAGGWTGDSTAEDALGEFSRFPRWMWRNEVIKEFIQWMRRFNLRPENAGSPAHLYGLDLYSLHASMDAVVRFLEKTDPSAARRAKARYACFDSFGASPQLYGLAAKRGLGSCESAVIEQLVELQKTSAELHCEEAFLAKQNARVVKNAEAYYRALFDEDTIAWNLRDQHMAETLESIVEHHGDSKAIVWAHNSHLGDARATEMADRGEWNVGQLMRQRYGDDCFTLGFSTYSGTVTAARDWDQPPERRHVRPALAGSYEALLHIVGGNFWLNLHPDQPVGELLREPRLERAIGVIYRPESERGSHYFYSVLPGQFDVIVHFDYTRALDPLDRNAKWDRGELPETYPSAL
ncbi:MAG: hypothetical protein JWL90_3274 [Chthoniobacteraceae bacterium]|nr:hypothetical protein [Chthoniobacteraceae bacterium]